jgi:hypothetical protein
MKYLLIYATLLTASGASQADTPAFDRPGIAFSTQTLPVGTMNWEQGLPDIVHDNQQGTSSTLFSADTRIRVGVTSTFELQLADALYNRLRTRSDDTTTVDKGYGDLTVAIKAAPFSPLQNVSWALLGSLTLNTGSESFRNDTKLYSLAGSASVHIGDDRALGLFASVTRAGKDNSYTLSPNFGWALNNSCGAYVEAGYTFGDHIEKDEVAGGGLTWMASNTVQLDIYGLRGLTSRSTAVQAGIGFSVYFP